MTETPERKPDPFREADQTLKAHLLAEQEDTRRQQAPLDSDFGDERSELRAELAHNKRDRLLPKDMMCPSCGHRKPRSRQWAVGPWQKILVCKACRSMTSKPELPNMADALRHGPALRQLRLALGVSAADFGRHCKWSGSYQCRLEKDDIPQGRRAKILAATQFLTSLPYRT